MMTMRDADLARRLMAAKKLSGRQLARKMKWSSHTYANRIIAGEVNVSTETAGQIAYFLGVPVDLIFVPKVSGETPRTVQKVS